MKSISIQSIVSLYNRNSTLRSSLRNGLFFVQLILFMWISKSIVQKSFFNKGDVKTFSNSFCEHNDCTREYNYDKFLFFWLDGLSWDTAAPIFEEFATNENSTDTNAHLYRVVHSVSPWSGAVFSTYISGKTGKNVGSVDADNLVYQLQKNDHKMYLGCEVSESYVLYGVDKYVDGTTLSYYPGVKSDDETLSPFGWFFDCPSGDERQCAFEKLDQVKSEERSMFFETFFIDHKQHFEVESRYDPLVLDLISSLALKLSIIKQWINQNPDYLLVVVSDHGGKTTVAGDPHGPVNDPDNAAWSLFYSPLISTSPASEQVEESSEELNEMESASEIYKSPFVKRAPTIAPQDVCPTFWQYLSSGLSLPAESVGVVSPAPSNNTDHLASVLKVLTLNAEEMIGLAQHVGLHGPQTELPRPTGDTEHDVEQMQKFVQTLSNTLQDSQRVTSLFAACALLIIIQFVRVTKAFVCRKDVCIKSVIRLYSWYLPAPFIVAIVLGRFTAGLIWAGTPNNETYIFIIAMLSVAVMAIITKSNNNNNNSSSVRSARTPASARLLSVSLSSSKETYVALQPLGNESNVDESEYDEEKRERECSEQSAGLDLPPAPRSTSVWLDLLSERQWGPLLNWSTRYVFGMCRLDDYSPSSFWMVMYILSFGLICSFVIGLPLESFAGITSVHAMHSSPSLLLFFRLLVLFFEFRLQNRVRRTKRRETNNAQKISLSDVRFYVKVLVYFTLALLMYNYDGSAPRSILIYGICFVHIAVLVISRSGMQSDLVLPLFCLSLFVSQSEEQLTICYFVMVMSQISNVLTYRRAKSMICDNVLVSYLVMIMIVTTHYFFVYMVRQEYSTSVGLDLNVTGVEDVTQFPKFSVFIMLFHKMSLFILLVPFLLRLASSVTNPLPVEQESKEPDTSSDDDDHSRLNLSDHVSGHTLVWEFLLFFGVWTVLFYLTVFVVKQMDGAFVWTATAIIAVNVFGLCFAMAKVTAFLKRIVGGYWKRSACARAVQERASECAAV